MPSQMQEKHLHEKCQVCDVGYMGVPINEQEWHLVCSECGAILFCYEPMPHQSSYHKDAHKYRMYAGGFGSAKTSTSCAEFIRHIYETPGGAGLIGAATLPQLEQTAQKEFLEMFPAEHILHYHKQKNYIDCINGFRVIFRPLDDEGKAKSLNLTAFWIEEASEVKYEYFVQLQTRLRNRATTKHMGLLSTNPDMGWIKTEILLKSDKIEGGDVDYSVSEGERNSNIATYIAETKKNIYLPPDFYDTTAKGKPDWWVRRFLHGSFENREGLVYPQLMDKDIYVKPFEIPGHWQRFFALDPGLRDPTAVLWGAVDPKDGILYLYHEHYERNRPVNHHAEIINKVNDDIPAGMLYPPIGDPSGKQRGKEDMRSVFDHYAEYGIYLQPASNKIEDGIQKVYNYLDLKKVRIFDTLECFRWEGQRYKYPPRKLDDDDKINNANVEKPLDKDNHLMDTIRYIIQELPDHPEDLINNSYGVEIIIDEDQTHLPFALQDDQIEEEEDWLAYY